MAPNRVFTFLTGIYVTIKFLSSTGKPIAPKSRTITVKGESDPSFDETFIFPLSEEEFHSVGMMFVLKSIDVRTKLILGWFGLGQRATGEREKEHWRKMSENKDQTVIGWHVLLAA